jgi:hypothetical protein
MIADPKRKPYQDDGASDKRRRQEEALDEALENTFPASDPVSAEQPTTTGAPVVPALKRQGIIPALRPLIPFPAHRRFVVAAHGRSRRQ